MMKTSDYIEDKINKLPKGYIFTYVDFITEVNKREAIIKHLNRMVASGKISKLSKGKYYKPQETVFGMLLPDQYQIVKDLLEDNNGKIIGYITRLSFYNTFALTTQVRNTIPIAKQEIRPSFKRGNFTISFIKQKNTINKQNIPLLQLLDAIRYIKKIPNTTVNKSCVRLLSLLKELSSNEKEQIIKLALKYPPRVVALLGALLEEIGVKNLDILKQSLNPISVYKLGLSNSNLSTLKNWNIK